MSRKRNRPRRHPTPAQDRQAALDELWSRLPKLDCQGLCWDSCGPIQMTELERSRIRERHAITIPDRVQAPALCPALTMLNRCGVHRDRPTICRLWGLVPSMRCNYGCQPEGGLLDEREAHLLLADVWELAGDHERAAATRAQWDTPEAAAQSERALRALMSEIDENRRMRQRHAEQTGTAIYVRGRGAGLTRDRTPQCG